MKSALDCPLVQRTFSFLLPFLFPILLPLLLPLLLPFPFSFYSHLLSPFL